MSKYKLAIFDLDGTVLDTSDGIVNSYKHIINKYDFEKKSDQFLKDLIGGDLYNNIKNTFSLTDDKALEVIGEYRTYYATQGKKEFTAYDYIFDCIKSLKENDIKVCIATLKLEDFAVEMIESLGHSDLFEYICGMDSADTLSKSNMIDMCIKKCNVTSESTVMIGDSMGDYNGAVKSKVEFIGVTYGFGLKNTNLLAVESAQELQQEILK